MPLIVLTVECIFVFPAFFEFRTSPGQSSNPKNHQTESIPSPHGGMPLYLLLLWSMWQMNIVHPNFCFYTNFWFNDIRKEELRKKQNSWWRWWKKRWKRKKQGFPGPIHIHTPLITPWYRNLYTYVTCSNCESTLWESSNGLGVMIIFICYRSLPNRSLSHVQNQNHSNWKAWWGMKKKCWGKWKKGREWRRKRLKGGGSRRSQSWKSKQQSKIFELLQHTCSVS